MIRLSPDARLVFRKMILYIAYFKVTDKKKERQILPEHLDYVNRLLHEKIIVAKGPFTDKSGGLIIYNTPTLEEATQYVMNDPVIRHGSRTVEIKEWKSTLTV